VCGQDPEKLE
jgi:hypothetical protein